MTALDSPVAGQPGTGQPWRPRLHLTPAHSRMTDPNGLVWHSAAYHLYFQCSPDDAWAPVSWGHATSPDLLRWTEHQVAIPATDDEHLGTGGVVLDPTGSAGLVSEGATPLVAVFGVADPSSGQQGLALATSVDGGFTWRRLPRRPVFEPAGQEPRDPKVLWYAPGGFWVMVAVLPEARVVQFWTSSDLCTWRRSGEFGPFGAPGARWEAPVLLPVPIDGHPEGAVRWLLAVSVNPRTAAGGSGMVYAVGDFDGHRFTAVPEGDAVQAGDAFGPFSWVDHGPDFYAATTLSPPGRPQGQGPYPSPMWVGWLGSWAYADVTPTSPWHGVQSLPRTLRLADHDGRYELVQRPLPELATTRQGIGSRLLHVDLSAQPGAGDVRRRVPGVGGTCLEVRVDLEVGPGARAGVDVLMSADGVQRTRICWDEPSGALLVDRRASGVIAFHPDFAAVAEGPLDGVPVIEGPAAGGRRVRFTVFVDVSCVEVFGGTGQTVLSAQVFPDPGSTLVSMVGSGGPVIVRELQAWELHPPPDVP